MPVIIVTSYKKKHKYFICLNLELAAAWNLELSNPYTDFCQSSRAQYALFE